jgi:hypothetical protein
MNLSIPNAHFSCNRVAKLEAALKVATVKVAASEEAANEALTETIASASDNELQVKLDEAVKRTAAAVDILKQVLELSANSDEDATAQVRLCPRFDTSFAVYR